MMSTTFPVAPLHSPTSGHKFIASITEACLARNKMGTNPDISSEGNDLAVEDEWRVECKLLVEKASAVLSDCMQQHHRYHKIIL